MIRNTNVTEIAGSLESRAFGGLEDSLKMPAREEDNSLSLLVLLLAHFLVVIMVTIIFVTIFTALSGWWRHALRPLTDYIENIQQMRLRELDRWLEEGDTRSDGVRGLRNQELWRQRRNQQEEEQRWLSVDGVQTFDSRDRTDRRPTTSGLADLQGSSRYKDSMLLPAHSRAEEILPIRSQ